MSRVVHTICNLLEQGEDLVLATILSQEGSTPRTAGTRMIGSRRKRDRIYDELKAQDLTAEDQKRVHSPIGTSIGAETPEEIGVSIVGELIQARSERNQ